MAGHSLCPHHTLPHRDPSAPEELGTLPVLVWAWLCSRSAGGARTEDLPEVHAPHAYTRLGGDHSCDIWPSTLPRTHLFCLLLGLLDHAP